MKNLFVSKSEYGAIKKDKDVLILVETKGESPIL